MLPANYPTTEFTACGALWHGLGTCVIKSGQPYDTVQLIVQGYVNGTVRVVSENCALDETFRYTASQPARVLIPGSALKSCLVSMVVMPEYPGEASSGVVVRSFTGALWVHVAEEGDRVLAFESKSPLGSDAVIRLPSEGLAQVPAVFRGCGLMFNGTLKADPDGTVPAWLSALGMDLEKRAKQCVIQGRIDLPSGPTYVSWMLWSYGKEYVPLAIPAWSLKGDELTVQADAAVSLVWLDTDSRYATSATFKKFDKAKPHLLRIITVGGRSVLGTWKEGAFTWIH